GTSFHYIVADASGRSAILEWVGTTDKTDNDGSARKLVVHYNDGDSYVGEAEANSDFQWITNFIVQPGYYGEADHMPGVDRYDRIYEELAKTNGVLADEEAAMDILAIVGRRTWNNDDNNGCTVHSVVYNLTDKTIMWIPNENYSDETAVFKFKLGE
ncbi:MAG: acyl-CoA--6-aminopenicillanic acid acyltransferase, partial [Clostridia bacterium]|nr:acyl-CoA--6-aminopenicillanic acid acyltransferase [Clostridia bacterium]